MRFYKLAQELKIVIQDMYGDFELNIEPRTFKTTEGEYFECHSHDKTAQLSVIRGKNQTFIANVHDPIKENDRFVLIIGDQTFTIEVESVNTNTKLAEWLHNHLVSQKKEG